MAAPSSSAVGCRWLPDLQPCGGFEVSEIKGTVMNTSIHRIHNGKRVVDIMEGLYLLERSYLRGDFVTHFNIGSERIPNLTVLYRVFSLLRDSGYIVRYTGDNLFEARLAGKENKNCYVSVSAFSSSESIPLDVIRSMSERQGRCHSVTSEGPDDDDGTRKYFVNNFPDRVRSVAAIVTPSAEVICYCVSEGGDLRD